MAKLINRINRDESGITGLETAIILIAFIVVASVFAYTVLSAGLFSSQKVEGVVRSGIEDTQSTLCVRGNVLAYKGTANGDECVTKISFTIGKAQAGGGAIDLTPFYRLDANGALVSPIISDCDTTWTTTGITNVTSSVDASDFKETPRSAKLIVATGFTTGNMAYQPLSTALDLTYANQMSVWIKSSADQTAGAIQMKLCSDSSAATAVETVNMPALSADVWTEAIVALNNPGSASLSSINSVAISAASDPGAVTLHIDEVKTRESGSVGKNVTMIAYSDANTFIDDVAWTVEFAGGYGTGAGDYLLQNSEKATITVWLHNYDGTTYSNGTNTDDPFLDSNGAHLKTSSMFQLQIMPPAGATLLLEKRTPAYLDAMMRLL